MGKQAQHALPQERKRAKTKGATTVRRRFKAAPKWITVRRPARCAELKSQTQIESGERGFYTTTPGNKSPYGSRCGHGERAERDFAAHWIDEDGY